MLWSYINMTSRLIIMSLVVLLNSLYHLVTSQYPTMTHSIDLGSSFWRFCFGTCTIGFESKIRKHSKFGLHSVQISSGVWFFKPRDGERLIYAAVLIASNWLEPNLIYQTCLFNQDMIHFLCHFVLAYKVISDGLYLLHLKFQFQKLHLHSAVVNPECFDFFFMLIFNEILKWFEMIKNFIFTFKYIDVNFPRKIINKS